MAKHTTKSAELRALSAEDLRKEIAEQRDAVAKMHMGISLRSHKDTAVFKREKKQLARMLTALRQNESSKGLKTEAKTATVPASVRQKRTTADKSASSISA
jgi:ribosomal protein L29